eukprot:GHVT01103112.1.p1 GENE.GHVT01103112.1~~GHVT01103112.1.p1  ORF type:complete len:465 (+),score=8.15 GHVT01103112.1:763-2157(+)
MSIIMRRRYWAKRPGRLLLLMSCVLWCFTPGVWPSDTNVALQETSIAAVLAAPVLTCESSDMAETLWPKRSIMDATTQISTFYVPAVSTSSTCASDGSMLAILAAFGSDGVSKGSSVSVCTQDSRTRHPNVPLGKTSLTSIESLLFPDRSDHGRRLGSDQKDSGKAQVNVPEESSMVGSKSCSPSLIKILGKLCADVRIKNFENVKTDLTEDTEGWHLTMSQIMDSQSFSLTYDEPKRAGETIDAGIKLWLWIWTNYDADKFPFTLAMLDGVPTVLCKPKTNDARTLALGTAGEDVVEYNMKILSLIIIFQIWPRLKSASYEDDMILITGLIKLQEKDIMLEDCYRLGEESRVFVFAFEGSKVVVPSEVFKNIIKYNKIDQERIGLLIDQIRQYSKKHGCSRNGRYSNTHFVGWDCYVDRRGFPVVIYHTGTNHFYGEISSDQSQRVINDQVRRHPGYTAHLNM